MDRIARRTFLKATAGTALGAGLANLGGCGPGADPNGFPRRRLGKTGYQATIVSLGGGATVREPDQREEAIEIVRRAVDLGINYIDTADTYKAGTSEAHIGEALDGRREKVFLATKTRERRAEPIRAGAFDQSCERLQTEVIDLYFLHAVHTAADLDVALDRDGGAITAFEHYRDAGRIRYLGISSHTNEVLIKAMDRYDFDCVFVTLNAAGMSMNDPGNTEAMLAKAAANDVGVVAMKIFGGPGSRILERGISAEQTLRYTLSFPVCTANIGVTTIDQVDANIHLAKSFEPYTRNELDELARVAQR